MKMKTIQLEIIPKPNSNQMALRWYRKDGGTFEKINQFQALRESGEKRKDFELALEIKKAFEEKQFNRKAELMRNLSRRATDCVRTQTMLEVFQRRNVCFI